MGAQKRRGTKTKSKTREKPQQIADELRSLIIAGELSEGDSLGHEPDLVERFGVSRPSLREALRILEAEGFITVVRGVRGGVVVHEPDQRMTAGTVAMVLQARNVALADVFEARAQLEPLAARAIASMRWSPVDRLRALRPGHPRGSRGRGPDRLRRRQRRVPRAPGGPRRQPDPDDRRRDDQRDRGPGGHRGAARPTTPPARCRSAAEASSPSDDCSSCSSPATARRPRSSGAPTWPSSAG